MQHRAPDLKMNARRRGQKGMTFMMVEHPGINLKNLKFYPETRKLWLLRRVAKYVDPRSAGEISRIKA